MAVYLPRSAPPGLPAPAKGEAGTFSLNELKAEFERHLRDKAGEAFTGLGLDPTVVATAAALQCFQQLKADAHASLPSATVTKWIQDSGNILLKGVTLSGSPKKVDGKAQSRSSSAEPVARASHGTANRRSAPPKTAPKQRSTTPDFSRNVTDKLQFLTARLPLSSLRANDLFFQLAALSDDQGWLSVPQFTDFFQQLQPQFYAQLAEISASNLPDSGYEAAMDTYRRMVEDGAPVETINAAVTATYALGIWSLLSSPLPSPSLSSPSLSSPEELRGSAGGTVADFADVAAAFLPFVGGSVRDKAAVVFKVDDPQKAGGLDRKGLRKLLAPLLYVAFDLDAEYGRWLATTAGLDPATLPERGRASDNTIASVANALAESAFFMSSEAVFSGADGHGTTNGVSCIVAVDGFVRWLAAVGFEPLFHGGSAVGNASTQIQGMARKRDRSWGGDDDADQDMVTNARKRQETDKAIELAGAHTSLDVASEVSSSLQPKAAHFRFEHGKTDKVRGSSHRRSAERHRSKHRRSRSRSRAPDSVEAAPAPARANAAPPAPHTANPPFVGSTPQYTVPGTVFKTASPLVRHVSYVHPQVHGHGNPPLFAPSFHYVHGHVPPPTHNGGHMHSAATKDVIVQHSGNVFAALNQFPWLQSLRLEDAVQPFSNQGDSLTAEQLVHGFRKLASKSNTATASLHGLDTFAESLFHVLDAERVGVVALPVVAAALSTVCGGDYIAKVKSTFQAFDIDGNGKIDENEAKIYLSTVYRMLAASRPEVWQHTAPYGLTPDELASVTAKQLVLEADKDNDGTVSQSEFVSYVLNQDFGAHPSGDQQHALRCHKQFHIYLYSAPDVLESFAILADEDGFVSREDFVQCLEENYVDEPNEFTRACCHRFFSALMQNEDDDRVDFMDAAPGLLLACSGDLHAKAKLVQELLGVNEKFVRRDDWHALLHSAICTAAYLSDESAAVTDIVVPSILSSLTYQLSGSEAFNGSSSLSATELLLATVLKTLNGKPWATLSGENLSVEKFVSVAFAHGSRRVYRQIEKAWQRYATVTPEVLAQTLNSIFGSVISSSEAAPLFASLMGSGQTEAPKQYVLDRLSTVLCISAAEHLHAAFVRYDENGDGRISTDEMEHILTEVFKNLLREDRHRSAVHHVFANSSIDLASLELAKATTAAAFEEADKDRDGTLSEIEFQDWLSSTKHASHARDAVLGFTTERADHKVLGKLLRHPSLGSLSLDSLLEYLYSEDRPLSSIYLTSESIERLLASLLNVDDEQLIRNAAIQLHALLAQIETAVNAAAPPEVISAWSVAVALLPHCGASSQQDKIERMFVLCDSDGTMHLAFHKLWRAFLVAFSVLLSADQAFEAFAGFSASELAAIATTNCFWDGDQGKSGFLTYSAFKDMCARNSAASILVTTLDGVAHASVMHLADNLQPHVLHLESGSIPPHARQATDAISAAGAASHPYFVGPETAKSAPHAGSGVLLEQLQYRTDLNAADARSVVRGLLEKAVPGTIFIGGVKANTKYVRRIQFLLALQAHIKGNSQAEMEEGASVLSHLFNIYLVKRGAEELSDIADAHALCVALSLLCGDMDEVDRAHMTFQLFDTDGSGDISFSEAVVYISSVVTLTAALNPSQLSQTGASPRAVAIATARDLFAAADVNGDGYISKDEFFSYMLAKPLPRPMTVTKLRTVLAQFRPFELLEVFAEYAAPQGLLSQEGFILAFEDCRQKARKASQLTMADINSLKAVFWIFEDSVNPGNADFVDMMTALLSICGGSQAEKLDAITACYDPENAGVITVDDVHAYFISLFMLLAGCDPHLLTVFGLRDQVEREPAQLDLLASAISEQALACCSKEHGIGRTAFCRWYVENFPEISTAAVEPALESDPAIGDMSWSTSEEASRLLHLSGASVAKLLELFAVVADENGSLTRSAFDAVFASLAMEAEHAAAEAGDDPNHVAFTPVDRKRARFIRSAIFDAFDTNHDGVVDAPELVAGLTILAKGSRGDKIRAAFTALDLDKDGKISFEELQMYLQSVFTVLVQCDPTVAETFAKDPADLAHAAAIDLFRELDGDKSGFIDATEFAAAYGEPRSSDIMEDPFQALDPSVVAGLLHLDTFEPEDISDIFDMCADTVLSRHPALSRQAFCRACRLLVKLGVDQGPHVSEAGIMALGSVLFDLLDVDGDEIVSSAELLAGFCVLMPGSQRAKVAEIFRAFDENGDGVLSKREMAAFLFTVYTVMYRLGSFGANIPPKVLAMATTQQVFDDYRVKTGLSLQQFQQWFSL